MIPEYVERVVNWPSPTSVKELNTFLGFSGYYITYIRSALNSRSASTP